MICKFMRKARCTALYWPCHWRRSDFTANHPISNTHISILPCTVEVMPAVRSRRLEYVRKYARGFKPVFDGYCTTTPWTTFVYPCLKTSPPKTRSGASSPGWPQTGHPHTRGPLLPARQPSRRRMTLAQRLQRGRRRACLRGILRARPLRGI